jgi:hypothetical protein
VVVSNVGKDPSDEVRREMARRFANDGARGTGTGRRIALVSTMMDDDRTVEEIKADLMTAIPLIVVSMKARTKLRRA